MGLRLALFDIDGTLTATSGLYDDLYCRVFSAALGGVEIDRDWSAYPDATDSAIAEAIFRRHRGRAPTSDELLAVRRRYFSLLEEAVAPDLLVPGARTALARVAEAGWTVGIVTGNWAPAARIKLERAGIDHGHLTMVTADDGHRRTELLEQAVAAWTAVDRGVERVVYLGDAAWDVRSARALGLPFIGVGRDPALAAASHRLEDYSEPRRLIDALRDARPPSAEDVDL